MYTLVDDLLLIDTQAYNYSIKFEDNNNIILYKELVQKLIEKYK